jgi:tRNA (guanine-N7-)-methyltransferase
MNEADSGGGDESGGEAKTVPPLIKTFVLRSGRMTDAQKRAISDFGDKYMIAYRPEPLDLRGLFDERKPLVVEIGFGMGAATWQIARDRPQFNYLGIEVHSPGVGRLIMEIRDKGLENLKIIQHDAVEVLSAMIPEESLAGLHIFYPDPWPKKRHHKRRLMRRPIVDLMIGRLAPGAYLYFVTDIEDYACSTMELLSACDGIENAYQGFAPRVEWRPETKFELKAKKADREAFELFFIKKT